MAITTFLGFLVLPVTANLRGADRAPDYTQCGVLGQSHHTATQRIVHGHDAGQCVWRWQVSLSSATDGQFCGGWGSCEPRAGWDIIITFFSCLSRFATRTACIQGIGQRGKKRAWLGATWRNQKPTGVKLGRPWPWLGPNRSPLGLNSGLSRANVAPPNSICTSLTDLSVSLAAKLPCLLAPSVRVDLSILLSVCAMVKDMITFDGGCWSLVLCGCENWPSYYLCIQQPRHTVWYLEMQR